MAVDRGGGGRREEVLRGGCRSMAGPSQGLPGGTAAGTSVTLPEGAGRPDSHPAGPHLEQVFALFADQTWKALLWKGDLQ